MKLSKSFLALRPCPEAVAWLKTQKSPAAAWRNCKRGDWMLWYVIRFSNAKTATFAAFTNDYFDFGSHHGEKVNHFTRCAAVARKHYPKIPTRK